ncbi:MAG: DNA polymerase, partial [Pyrinomonadaceae bacterium]
TLFDTHPSASSASAAAASYSIVQDRGTLDKLIRRLFEIEGWSIHVDDSNSDDKLSCFHKNEPFGVGIGLGNGEAFYIDLQNFSPSREAAIRPLSDILTNGFMDKSSHDIKRNWASLAKIGIEPASVRDDTMLGSYVLDSGRAHHTIPFLAQITLDLDIAREIPDGFEENVFRTAENADLVARLAPRMRQKIRQDGLEKVYAEIELPLVSILADIEMTGMKVDGDALIKFSAFISTELEELKGKIFATAGREFNIGSPKQVGEIFQELNIDTGRKTATGQVSTSRDVLDELALNYEIAQFIIDYREMDKLKATYADSLPRMIGSDGRIHGCLNQAVAATGRLSSTEPNLQNIPIRTELGQRIRSAFIPEKGNKLISADYSQLELRILAHITKDPVMLEA